MAALSALILIAVPFRPAQAFTHAVAVTIDDDDSPFVLDSSGGVWGYLQPDQLLQPVKLPNLSDVRQIVPFAALTQDGHVFTWDRDGPACPPEPSPANGDEYGGGPAPRFLKYSAPQEVPGLNDVISIAGGDRHFLALRADGTVVEFGAKLAAEDLAYPKFIDSCAALPSADRLPKPQVVASISNAIMVASDGDTDGVLELDGFFYYWGDRDLRAEHGYSKTDQSQIKKIFVGVQKTSILIHNYLVALSLGQQVYYYGTCLDQCNIDQRPVFDGKTGDIQNILKIALSYSDEFDAYVLKNGKIVLAFPSGTTHLAGSIFAADECTNRISDPYPQAEFFPQTPVEAIDAALPNELSVSLLLMVGADGSLWTMNSMDLNGLSKFTNINLP